MNQTMQWVQTVWDYLSFTTPLQPADIIIGFGSYNTEVPKRAAELYLQGLAKKVLFTGKLGKGTLGVWTKTEAETFRDIAVGCGVPLSDILIETHATNTGENIQFSKALLQAQGIHVRSMIAVQKAYMTRRVYAALRKQWPEIGVMTACPAGTLQQYLQTMAKSGVPQDETINSLVGDLQRMDVFARCGYQIEMDVPPEVWAAYRALADEGYTKYLMVEDG